MSGITVFISYSHDSEAHRDNVLALSERLRADGLNTVLDRYVKGSPEQGWPRWMLDQLDAASFVLVICTETYYRRFRGHEAPGKGKGADWEGALITQELYDARSRTLKFVPVFLADAVTAWIPEPLRSLNYYALTTEKAYAELYDFLLGQAGVEPGTVSALKRKPRATAQPLTFGKNEEHPAQPASLAQTGSDNLALQGISHSNVTINYNAPLPPKPSGSAAESQPRKVDISRIVKYAPAELIGRAAETALLHDAWGGNPQSSRPHILTFVAMGGEGKTSLVAKWAAELAAQDWPGCEAVFAWSFYSQGTREQVAASSDLFLAEALRFFGDEEMAGSAQGAYEKGQRLARLVGERRALLILDGVEPLQHAPTSPLPGELRDQGLAALLKGLAAHSRGLCVVTTRYAIPDLRAFLGQTVREEKLLRLSTAAGVALLKALGVKGSERKTIPSAAAQTEAQPRWNEYEALVEEVRGHALTLQIAGQFLVRAFRGDIRKRDRLTFEKAATKIQGGHAFRAMDAYVNWLANDSDEARRELALLSLLGLFDRPATADCLEALLRPPAIPNLTEPLLGLEEDDLWFSLTALRDAKLITFHDATDEVHPSSFRLPPSIDAHPLVREYFAKRVRSSGFSRKDATMPPEGGTTSEAWRAAHKRLYEHLCATTQEGDAPTLEDLQPLYQAVAHGCQAGLRSQVYFEAYWRRINKGDAIKKSPHYSTEQLGAFSSDLGALRALLYDYKNLNYLPAQEYQWMLFQMGLCFRALGHIDEALSALKQSKEQAKISGDAKAAARVSRIYAGILIIKGSIKEAFKEAEDFFGEIRQPGDWGNIVMQIATQASWLALRADDSHAQAKARKLFREATTITRKYAPFYPDLCSWPARNYADLDLRVARARAICMSIDRSTEECLVRHEVQLCKKWLRQANQCLKCATQRVDKAEASIVLARAKGYLHIFEQGFSLREVLNSFDNAIQLTRDSNRVDNLPQCLIDRSWFRILDDIYLGPDSAQEDLDEAWEIAERGSMRLHMADIHLYRARLFGRMRDEGGRMKEGVPYPWKSVAHDLAEAERLIRECGYGRRAAELADAKRALLGE